jgi:hypothetical protein
MTLLRGTFNSITLIETQVAQQLTNRFQLMAKHLDTEERSRERTSCTLSPRTNFIDWLLTQRIGCRQTFLEAHVEKLSENVHTKTSRPCPNESDKKQLGVHKFVHIE